jgi:hypothetical protein
MNEHIDALYRATAQELAEAYARLEAVQAVAWGGSQHNHTADAGSDIDLYVYADGQIDLDARRAIAHARGERIEVGNTFWEQGDEWDERASGIHIDIMFRDMGWVSDELARVFVRHEASIGYSTAVWHNVLTSEALFDRAGVFGRLQALARQPYPEALRQAIIARNTPLLRKAHGAFLGQIAKAAKRDDVVSLNHRVAALLASYFDILFALNRKPHPGEKRLLVLAARDCPVRPPHMDEQVRALLAAAGTSSDAAVVCASGLVEDIEALLREQGLTG